MIWDIDMKAVNDKDDVVVYLINNHEYLVELCSQFKRQYFNQLDRQDVLFHDDIKESYKSLLIQTITKEVCNRLGVPQDMVWEVLEDIDVMEYMR